MLTEAEDGSIAAVLFLKGAILGDVGGDCQILLGRNWSMAPRTGAQRRFPGREPVGLRGGAWCGGWPESARRTPAAAAPGWPTPASVSPSWGAYVPLATGCHRGRWRVCGGQAEVPLAALTDLDPKGEGACHQPTLTTEETGQNARPGSTGLAQGPLEGLQPVVLARVSPHVCSHPAHIGGAQGGLQPLQGGAWVPAVQATASLSGRFRSPSKLQLHRCPP